jgi:dTDP-4-amino-4,6-dideoxygalactose transaminase
MTAAFLFAQLENLDQIQEKRKKIWDHYYSSLRDIEEKGLIRLPHIPEYASNNASMFYILTENNKIRDKLLKYLNKKGIQAVFHYLPLHLSDYYKNKHDGRELANAVRYSETIIRLPFYYELQAEQQKFVCEKIKGFFG